MVQKRIARLSSREAVIGNGFGAEQNIRVTSHHWGCQRLTRFGIIVKAFSEPDGSWMGRKWRVTARDLENEHFVGCRELGGRRSSTVLGSSFRKQDWSLTRAGWQDARQSLPKTRLESRLRKGGGSDIRHHR